MVLKFRMRSWPSVAFRKSMVMGSMSEKSHEVDLLVDGSSSATASLG